MALVATRVARVSQDDLVQSFVTLAFDNSYPTGGEAITANGVGLTKILGAIIPGNKGFTFEMDLTNLKVIAYWVDTSIDGSPMLEVVNTTDLSAIVAAPAIFYGT